MLQPLRQTSITGKLILIIMSTSGVVLLLAAAGFATYEIVTSREAMVRNLSVLARVSGENSTAALMFDDPATARENLEALAAQPAVSQACIYTDTQRLFASYVRVGSRGSCPDAPARQDGHLFEDGRLRLARQLVFEGDRVGTVYVEMETQVIRTQALRYATIAGAILIVSSFVAFLLSRRLQRIVSDPILALTETASAVAENQDYSVRAQGGSEDELGVLAATFNEMLGVIQQHAEVLDSEVTERRRIEEELRRSLAKEKELADLKSHFVSVASHEFRTPLTTILAASDSLRKYGDRMTPEQRAERFGKIQSATRHMTELLEDVLVLGREESGQVRCAPQALDLRSLCDEMLCEVEATAGAAHRLKLSAEALPPTVMMDPKLLRQILSNLLTNAIKYSPEGGEVELSVRCDERLAELRVTDRGIGIGPEDLQRLFVPFHRGANVGQIAGSGLGLAILKKAVELHGGRISVDSALGVGTTFSVTLPTTGESIS